MSCTFTRFGMSLSGQGSDVTDAEKRPKQEHGGDENGAVKERVEIVLRQKRIHSVRGKRLSDPEKNRSKKRSDGNDRDKIGC